MMSTRSGTMRNSGSSSTPISASSSAAPLAGQPALPPLAVCTNHNPAHTALTMEEMLRKTDEHNCKGWRVAQG